MISCRILSAQYPKSTTKGPPVDLLRLNNLSGIKAVLNPLKLKVRGTSLSFSNGSVPPPPQIYNYSVSDAYDGNSPAQCQ